MKTKGYVYLVLGLFAIAVGVAVGGFTEEVHLVWIGAIIGVIGVILVWCSEPEKL